MYDPLVSDTSATELTAQKQSHKNTFFQAPGMLPTFNLPNTVFPPSSTGGKSLDHEALLTPPTLYPLQGLIMYLRLALNFQSASAYHVLG